MDPITLLLFFVGFFLLISGAESLIRGATALARVFNVSDLIIGLTVVAFGTSLPELIVNLFANVESGELAIGNILGSNIANILLILGVSAMIHPLSVHRTTVYREIIFNVAAAVMLGVLVSERFLSEGGFDGLDHIDGAVLISYFAIFLYYTFGRRGFSTEVVEEPKTIHGSSIARTTLLIAGGALGLYFGGRWIVDGAIAIASLFGVSDGVIGLTVVAIGTSLPELAASVTAVRQKNVDIAVGNVVGSNLFNIFWVLGLTAFIKPLSFSSELITDVLINLAVAVLLFGTMAFGRYKHQISKPEGRLFLTLYIVYIATTFIWS